LGQEIGEGKEMVWDTGMFEHGLKKRLCDRQVTDSETDKTILQ